MDSLRKLGKSWISIPTFGLLLNLCTESFSQGLHLSVSNGGITDFAPNGSSDRLGLEGGLTLFDPDEPVSILYSKLGGIFDFGYSESSLFRFGGGGVLSLGLSAGHPIFDNAATVFYIVSLNEYLIINKSQTALDANDAYSTDYVAASSISFTILYELKDKVFLGLEVGRGFYSVVDRAPDESDFILTPTQVNPWRIGLNFLIFEYFSGV
jgi:hypothetical protein